MVAGGQAPSAQVLRLASTDDLWIAADGGANHAVAAGRWPDAILGDLDSISPDVLSEARSRGIPVHEFSVDKDKTDLELALDAAAAHEVEEVLVIAASGGRRDHELANLLVLCHEEYRHLLMRCAAGDSLYTVVRGGRELAGRVGDLVSLLPLLGDASGVTTTGLRFGLVGETLKAASSRGVSNEFLEPRAHVEVRSGILLAVQPFALASDR